jgi:hypothetical protein
MLLAKIVAGLNLRFASGQDLLQLLDEISQVLAGKFPAEPKHQSCYLAHGGESLGNLAGSLDGDLGKRDFTAFLVLRSSPNPRLHSALQACKIQRTAARGRGIKHKSLLPAAIQPIIGIKKTGF